MGRLFAFESLSIHPSWQRVHLGEIADILNGFAFDSSKFSKNEGIPLLRIRDIGKQETDAFYFGEFDETYFIEPGDLIIGMDGDFNCERWLGERALLNQRVCKLLLRSQYYNPKFLDFTLPGYLKAINDNTSSVTVKHLSSKTVSEIPLPLPPFPEQARIVAKIEELFTQLDAGVAALQRVQAGLKRYKASVLKAAVEGRLVAQDPNDGPTSELLKRMGKKPLKDNYLPGLPSGWTWSAIDQLAAPEPYSITDGPFGSNLKTGHYTNSGPRVIRLQNIGNGEFRNDEAHISLAHFEILKKHEIYAGDLVIAALGESLPRACMIPEYVGPAIVKADCIRFKPNVEIAQAKYLNYALNSEPIKKFAMRIVHGVGRPRLNQQEIKSIPLPIPPLPEQHRIIDEIERRLSVAQELDTVVEKMFHRSQRLKQSILARAFAGKLGSQNPEDEPAEKLLERIRSTRKLEEARKKAEKPQKGRKKMTTDERKRRPLYEVLNESGIQLTPEQLFSKAGYDEESVDEFYQELRDEEMNGHIKIHRPNQADVFLESALR